VTPAYGCVVLTAGRRPHDLRRAVESLLRQCDVALDVVVVGNGSTPAGVPDGVRIVPLAHDDGIPAGRNAGVPHVHGELLFFLDDDAEVARDDALARVAALFDADPALGLVQLGPQAREPGGRRSRDWVPRLRVGDPSRPSESTVVWEGAVAIRRAAWDQAGPWPAEFRFVTRASTSAGGSWTRAGPCATRATSRSSTRRPPGPRTAIRTISVRATECGSRAATCRCRSGSCS
jgi:GT2 family glycosyltransferase